MSIACPLHKREQVPRMVKKDSWRGDNGDTNTPRHVSGQLQNDIIVTRKSFILMKTYLIACRGEESGPTTFFHYVIHKKSLIVPPDQEMGTRFNYLQSESVARLRVRTLNHYNKVYRSNEPTSIVVDMSVSVLVILALFA